MSGNTDIKFYLPEVVKWVNNLPPEGLAKVKEVMLCYDISPESFSWQIEIPFLKRVCPYCGSKRIVRNGHRKMVTNALFAANATKHFQFS